MFKLGYRF